MVHKQKVRKPTGRNERHSAAWGKRLGMMILLATGMALGQNSSNQSGNHGRIASELSGLLSKAHQGTAQGQTVKVIVQYRQGGPAPHHTPTRGAGGGRQGQVHPAKG